MTGPRILVVGAGAVGGYFGSRLVEAGRDVTFLVRPARAAAIAGGLTVRTPEGDSTIVPSVVTADRLTDAVDLVLLSVKAFALDAAIADFAPAVGENTLVLPVLNGMKHVDQLRARFGERVLGGSCVVAAQLDDDGSVRRLYGAASLTYGRQDGGVDDRMRELDETLTVDGYTTRLSTTVQLDMWEKWMMLASAGALTCLLRGTVGEVEASPGGEQTALTILDEVVSVIVASGFTPRPKPVANARAMLTTVGSSFTTSMYRDLVSGQATEADQIVGDLVNRARLLGVPVPLLTAAYASLVVSQDRRRS